MRRHPELGQVPCGKVCHQHHRTAREHLATLNRYHSGRRNPAQPGKLNVYWCGRCVAYHVGHKPAAEHRANRNPAEARCGRVCHYDPASAERHLAHVARIADPAVVLEIYWCGRCVAYHVGHHASARRAARLAALDRKHAVEPGGADVRPAPPA